MAMKYNTVNLTKEAYEELGKLQEIFADASDTGKATASFVIQFACRKVRREIEQRREYTKTPDGFIPVPIKDFVEIQQLIDSISSILSEEKADDDD